MMHTASSTLANGVDAWLDRATGGLCAEAAARVRREVVEHCVASLDAKLAAGMPEEVAERAAVAELGNWRAARRRFKRTHLTKWDLKRLAFINGRPVDGFHPPSMWGMMGVCACFWLLMSVVKALSATSPHVAVYEWSLALVLMWSAAAGFLIGLYRWRPALGETRVIVCRVHIGGVLASLCVVLAALNLAAMPGANAAPWSGAWWYLIAPTPLALMMLLCVHFDWRLARKLPSHVGKGAA